MKKNLKYYAMLIVVLLMFIMVYSCSNNNSEKLIKVNFPLSYKVDSNVIYPPDVFLRVPTLYIDGWAILDFINMKNIYSWQMADDFSGELSFRLLVDFSKNISQSGDLPEMIHFELFNNRGTKKTIIIDEKITSDRWKSKNKRTGEKIAFKFRSKFKIPVKLLKDDLLVYRMSFPNNYSTKNITYGISIPKIDLTKPENELAPENTNLIIISIDTLRSDYLGAYKKLSSDNNELSYSPNLDLFAREAVIFKNAYTPISVTWPALASIFTSLYPSEHGVTYNGMNSENSYRSIATYMVQLGYNTLSILGNASSLKIPGIIAKMNFFNKDFKIIKQALHELQKEGSRTFFHWYHFMGVHSEYKPAKWNVEIFGDRKTCKDYVTGEIMKKKIPVSSEDLNNIKKLYAAELYSLDSELKKIFDFLKSKKKWESSMIIITADHGEDLYEHNNFFHHYPSLYNSSLKIPMMIKFPHQKKKVIIAETVSLLDIFPTIVDYFTLTDKTKVSDYKFSGMSLLSLLKGNNLRFKSRTIFASIDKNKIIAAIKNGWKLIYNPKKIKTMAQFDVPYNYSKLELYNFANDIKEKHNIFKKNRKLISEFIKSINSYLREKNTIRKGLLKKRKYENSPETLKRLKTLGYID